MLYILNVLKILRESQKNGKNERLKFIAFSRFK